MTVETNARFLSELNESYPRNRDLIKEGDDHIRLIKNVLKNTFPAIDGAVKYSTENLNKMNSTFVYDGEALGVNSSLTFAEKLDLDMGGNVVKNVGDPVDPQDAVTLNHMHTIGAWPVGSVFFTVDSRNPSEILGFGTWREFAAGRVIIGTGSNTDSNSETRVFANESTGGAYAHTLEASEMPTHNHEPGEDLIVAAAGNHSHQYGLGRAYDESGTGRPQIGGGQSRQTWAVGYNTDIHNGGIGYDGEHTHTLSGHTSSAGGGGAHNNIQPYIAVNIWLRVNDPTP